MLPIGDTRKWRVRYLVVTMRATECVIALKHITFFLEQELHLLEKLKVKLLSLLTQGGFRATGVQVKKLQPCI